MTDESTTLLWLNPPYKDNRHGYEKRLKLVFLKSTTPKIVGDEVLTLKPVYTLLPAPLKGTRSRAITFGRRDRCAWP